MNRARFILGLLAGLLGWNPSQATAATTTLYLVTATGKGQTLAIWDRHDALVARTVTRQSPQPLRIATAINATYAPFHATCDGIACSCTTKVAA